MDLTIAARSIKQPLKTRKILCCACRLPGLRCSCAAAKEAIKPWSWPRPKLKGFHLKMHLVEHLGSACLEGAVRYSVARGIHLDAHRLEVHLVPHLTNSARRGKECLGGYTAPVHTSAADVVALDDSDRHALLHSVQCGPVAPYATADDDEVVVICCCCCSGDGAGCPGTLCHLIAAGTPQFRSGQPYLSG
jgi:hypothetical protein